MFFKRSILFLILSAIIVSCGLQFDKRRYNKGYYVHSAGKSSKAVSRNAVNKTEHFINHTSLAKKPMTESAKTAETVINTSSYSSKPEVVALKNNPTAQLTEVASGKVKHFGKRNSSSGSLLSGGFKNENSHIDNYLYGLAGSMVLLSFFGIRVKREKILKMTREANRNIRRTRVKIWLMQTGILVLGFFAGKNLHTLGYSFSENAEYVYGGVSTLGFGALFLQQIIGRINDMKNFFWKKLGFLVLGTCFIGSSVVIGNKAAAEKEQISPMGHVMRVLDSGLNYITGNEKVSTVPLTENERIAIGFKIFGCILLCFILTILTAAVSCAAVCCIVFVSESPVLILGAIAFAFLAFLLVYGIMGIIKGITGLFKKLHSKEVK